MKSLLRSMFSYNTIPVKAVSLAAEDYHFESSIHEDPGMEVQELSYEDYLRVMKIQEKSILL